MLNNQNTLAFFIYISVIFVGLEGGVNIRVTHLLGDLSLWLILFLFSFPWPLILPTPLEKRKRDIDNDERDTDKRLKTNSSLAHRSECLRRFSLRAGKKKLHSLSLILP